MLDDDADDETEDAHFQALNQRLKQNKAKERETMAAAAAKRSSTAAEVKEITKPEPKPVVAVPPKTGKKSSAVPSRAEMEQERLARQRKLQGLSDDAPDAKRVKMSPNDRIASDKIQSSNAQASSSTLPSDHPYRHTAGRDAAGDYYIDGELRHTHLDIGDKTKDPVWTIGAAMGKVISPRSSADNSRVKCPCSS